MSFEVDLNGKKQLRLETLGSEIIEPMTGWSRRLYAGQFIKVMDVRGKQAADLWAFNALLTWTSICRPCIRVCG